MNAEEYVEIGHYLRDVRENFGVSPQQAAAQLHMRVKYILSIENGNFEEMPGRAYLRGYIRNYAEYLKLDGDAILLRYETLFSSAEKAYFVPRNLHQSNMPSGLLILLCLVLLIGGYSYWYSEQEVTSAAPDPVPEAPATTSNLSKSWENCLQHTILLLCRYHLDDLPEKKDVSAFFPAFPVK